MTADKILSSKDRQFALSQSVLDAKALVVKNGPPIFLLSNVIK